jgi:hypothetical protein
VGYKPAVASGWSDLDKQLRVEHQAFAVPADGEWAAAGTEGGKVVVWYTGDASGAPATKSLLAGGAKVDGLLASARGRRLFMPTGDAQLHVWNLSRTGAEPAHWVMPGHETVNEFSQYFTPGNMLTFELDLTNNPQPGGTPDEFTFQLIDNTLDEVSTTDPSGSDSLMIIDLTGSMLAPRFTRQMETGSP